MVSRAEETSLEALLATRPTSEEHAVKLAEDLYTFSVLRKQTDFKFRAGNKTAYCHSPVLSVQSPYFDSLCARGVQEATLDPCVGPREDGLALMQTVRYLYLGTMELTVDIVEPVVKSAKDINHVKLLKDSEKYMIKMLTITTFRKLADVAKKYALMQVGKACEQLQTSKFSALLQREWFLPSLTINDLRKYLQDDQLSVSNEDQVLNAVIKWLQMCTVSDKKQEEFADTLAPLIRLSKCNEMRLRSLAKDESVPTVFRFHLYEYLTNMGRRKDEKPRKVGSHDTGAAAALPRTSARMRTPPRRDEQTKQNIVIIGGRIEGNKSKGDIMYLENKTGKTNITKAKLCNGACYYSVSVYADEIIISGGYDKTLEKTVSSVHQFNFTSLQWIELPDLPHARTRHASLLTRHKLYIMFGLLEEEDDIKRWYNETIVLDLVTKTWSSLKNSPCALEFTSVAAVDDEIFAMGGASSDTMSVKTMKYNTARDSWMECQDMPTSLQYAVSSTVAIGNRIFVLMRDTFLVYDTQQDDWTRLQAPIVPSHWCSMVLLNNTLIAIGGYAEKSKNPHARVQSYDLLTEQWSLLEETMPKPLTHHTAIVLPQRP